MHKPLPIPAQTSKSHLSKST